MIVLDCRWELDLFFAELHSNVSTLSGTKRLAKFKLLATAGVQYCTVNNLGWKPFLSEQILGSNHGLNFSLKWRRASHCLNLQRLRNRIASSMWRGVESQSKEPEIQPVILSQCQRLPLEGLSFRGMVCQLASIVSGTLNGRSRLK